MTQNFSNSSSWWKVGAGVSGVALTLFGGVCCAFGGGWTYIMKQSFIPTASFQSKILFTAPGLFFIGGGVLSLKAGLEKCQILSYLFDNNQKEDVYLPIEPNDNNHDNFENIEENIEIHSYYNN